MVRRFFGPAKFNERRDFRFGEEIARSYTRSKSWLPARPLGCRNRSLCIGRVGSVEIKLKREEL
jgi:hypothetical protein